MSVVVAPLATFVAGVLILTIPRLLNYGVAISCIRIGVLGIVRR